MATETCVFENGSSRLLSEPEELRILQLSLTGHAFPTPLICLAITVHSALPPTCGAQRTGHPIPVEALQMLCKEEGLLPTSHGTYSCLYTRT